MIQRNRWAMALPAAALVLSTMGLASGCGASTSVAGAVTSSAQAGAAVAVVAPTEFAAAAQQPDTIVLDVRTPAEFAEGHLAGAVNVDVSSPDFAAKVKSLPKDRAYAVYCRSGNRSQAATAHLRTQGFGPITELDGGIVAWVANGGEVVTD